MLAWRNKLLQIFERIYWRPGGTKRVCSHIRCDLFWLCILNVSIRNWYRYRRFLPGDDPVRNLYGRTKMKIIPASEQCRLCQITIHTNVLLYKQVSGVVLSSLISITKTWPHSHEMNVSWHVKPEDHITSGRSNANSSKIQQIFVTVFFETLLYRPLLKICTSNEDYAHPGACMKRSFTMTTKIWVWLCSGF